MGRHPRRDGDRLEKVIRSLISFAADRLRLQIVRRLTAVKYLYYKAEEKFALRRQDTKFLFTFYSHLQDRFTYGFNLITHSRRGAE